MAVKMLTLEAIIKFVIKISLCNKKYPTPGISIEPCMLVFINARKDMKFVIKISLKVKN